MYLENKYLLKFNRSYIRLWCLFTYIVDDLVCRILAYTQRIKSSVLISIMFLLRNLGWTLDMPSGTIVAQDYM